MFEKETASQIFGSEWGALSATGFSRKLCPALSVYSGMHFPKGLVPENVPHSEPSNRDVLSARDFIRPWSLRRAASLLVVVLGFFSCIELQHAAAVFAHGELGALQATAFERGELAGVDLVAVSLIGKQVRRVHNTGIDMAARRLGGKTLGNRIERRQALEYATMAMRCQQLVLACEQARQIVMARRISSASEGCSATSATAATGAASTTR